MQLEQLLTSLGIPQFIPQLSEFRDNLLRVNAEELQALKTVLDDKIALIESAKGAIKNAIADPELDDSATVAAIANVVAVAELPAIEKRKMEIAAEIAKKQAELEAL